MRLSCRATSPYVDYSIYIRAGNAVGMMLVGGMGIVLGLAAYQAARREEMSAKN